MNHCRRFLLFFQLLIPCLLSSANLSITNLEWQDLRETGGGIHAQFTIRWDNAWRDDLNYDAAWVFIKLVLPDGGSRHLKVLETGHRLTHNLLPAAPAPVFQPAKDRTGLFIFPGGKYRGNVVWKVRAALDHEFTEDRSFGGLRSARMEAYGIEMVQIPAAPFTVGDPDTTALKFGAFYRSGGKSRFDGLIKITSESMPLEVGADAGQLCYHNAEPAYQVDLSGPVPAEFPKGVQGFFIMKYELTQGQYAGFLNAISNEQTRARSNITGRDYLSARGTIALEKGNYIAASPDRPCNFTSWDDACAFADWAALRPMTELEFEKACRGTGTPQPKEYAWGTSSKDLLARYINEYGDLVWETGVDESQLNDANRDIFGASYYWVFDLSGGALWERCITIGHPSGRSFKGSHGDGRLSYYGFANNEDWPKGSTEGAGWGFRGGGFYYFNQQYSEFNPHSPIAYRRFGAWAGGAREPAYGSRFVRTE